MMETSLPALPPAEVNLRDYLDILRRRKAIMLQTFVVVVAVGFIVTLMSKPVYEASAKLLVISGMPGLNIMNTENPLSAILQQAQPDSVATQVEVLQSQPFMAEARKLAGGSADVDSIRVASVEGTNIVRVTVQSHSPDYAAKLANSIVILHREQSKALAGEQISKALLFISEQAAEAKDNLTTAERELEDFRRTHRTDQMQKEAEGKREAWIDLDQKIRETESNLRMAQVRRDDLQARLERIPRTVAEATDRPNPKYDRLAQKLDAAQEQFQTVSEQYRADSPQYVGLQAQMTSLEQLLANTEPTVAVPTHKENPLRQSLIDKVVEADSSIEGLQAQASMLKAERDSKKAVVDRVGPWEIRLAAMQRDREQAEKAFLELSSRQRDLEIRDKAARPANRVLEEAATPSEPIRPKKATNIMLSIALALCLGVVMAFLQEYLDDRINSPEDADRAAHLPLLGHVPAIPEREPTVVTNLPARSHVAEAYRTLRSSIGFAAVDGSLNTLMITSASKGEGKTVTSLNLAIAMALDGKQVILVDADLRRPSVHKRLNLPQGPGLTDVLVGQREPAEVLNATEVAGLRVMSAGPIPPNPAELLNSQPMDRIIEQLREMADVVIFDSAPCIPVSDSIVLASKVDGVVLVVHAGETKKAAIKHTREMLDRARARTIGLVFNRVPQRKGGYYYYYYYYYGGYYEETADEEGRAKKGRRRRQQPSGKPDESAALARRETRSEQATHESDQEEAS